MPPMDGLAIAARLMARVAGMAMSSVTEATAAIAPAGAERTLRTPCPVSACTTPASAPFTANKIREVAALAVNRDHREPLMSLAVLASICGPGMPEPGGIAVADI